ncbi:hypothetical protein [Bacillus phage vB_BanS-Thrax2]|nr:hypothetical protein [Bacillus phage vB_BanS-Thrax2]
MMVKRKRKQNGFWSAIVDGMLIEMFFEGCLAIFKLIFKIFD